ncbi:hypothetical protein AARAC_001324 [Aspergillus arachidicola]|uniref:Zn(2)-C6 fungal-type domain-containing protein n=1 Tax=Aspergillus arachidicola TaxID=656916 RepID=A0A2G7FW51_9EURO|nr:hypothetical protein AARAC_001324 [Aspergillus arachidicola]
MDLQAKSNAFAQSTEHAALSCQECRRRKIKCDRQLPTCAACMGSSMDCVYPAGPLKPGPKAGFTRRAKKRRLEPQCHSPGTMDMRLRTMHPQHETNADLGQSFASHLPGKLSSMDTSTSPTQGCVSINSNEPSNRSLPSPSPEQKDFITHRRLSWLVHPNHEPTLKQSACGEQSTMEPLADQFTPLSIQASLMDQICLAFQTDEQDIHHLIALYFENMVSFLLFTPHLLTVKLQTAPPSQIIALLGAMFSFSARFRLENQFVNGVASASNQQATRPAPNDFYLIAKNSVDRELMDLKPPPSLLMLQSMVLLSFHDLIESAEGRGWRSLGLLVRIAYELRLHLVDSDVIDTSTDHPDLWSAKEERRRTWWVIWELDVFSSTVRRLPTAIDWNQNWTMLPVDDEFWLKKSREQVAIWLPIQWKDSSRFRIATINQQKHGLSW